MTVRKENEVVAYGALEDSSTKNIVEFRFIV